MSSSDFSFLDAFLVVFSGFIAYFMLRPGIRDRAFWQATVTPLASIIGSGFLVVVPLLASITGTLSVPAILAIVLLSFWLGAAVRFNILHDGRNPIDTSDNVARPLERLSDLALAGAYVISITFYIRLLSGFVLTAINAYTPFNADVVATLILAFIGGYGFFRGLHGLERLEEYSVTLKLAIIAALLLGLVVFDIDKGYSLAGIPQRIADPVEDLRKLAGMLLIVQGFETSKYLGEAYDKDMRARSMRLAQWLAGVIYVVFVILAMPLIAPYVNAAPDETAIIKLSAVITLVLPLLLVIAATMSQFSAAIADTIGAGGVIANESHDRFPAPKLYPLITLLAIGLMWTSNIFEVVTLASRAFAFYYLLQVLLAARLVYRIEKGRRRRRLLVSDLALALLLLAIVLFAKPVAM